jgi:hypothetical protein
LKGEEDCWNSAYLSLKSMLVDDHNQMNALGLIVAFPVVGGVAVFLRLWSRRISRYNYGWGEL